MYMTELIFIDSNCYYFQNVLSINFHMHFPASEHRYIDAVRAFTRAIVLVPKNAVYFSNRAQVYLNMRHFMKALDDWYLNFCMHIIILYIIF